MQTLYNGVELFTNGDPYNLADDAETAFSTANVIIKVNSIPERTALAAAAPGGVLPIPTTIVRMDVSGYPLEIWDGVTWNRQIQSSPFITTDTNWEYGGGLIRYQTQNLTIVHLAGTMKRIAGGNINFSSTTDVLMGTYIPAGWRPLVPSSAFVPVATGITHNGEPLITVNENGQMILHLGTGSMTIAVGATLNFCMSWYQ